MGNTFREAQPLLDLLPQRASARRTANAVAYHLVGSNLLRIAAREPRAQAARAAVEVFRSAAEEIPSDPSLYNALGGSLLAAARFQSGAEGLCYFRDAEQAFRTAAILAKEQSVQHAVRLRYAINLATAQWMRGERSDDSTVIGQAEHTLRSVAAELPASSPYWAHVQDNWGNALMALNLTAEAVAAYEAALGGRQSAAERARSLNNLGTARIELRNWAGARQCYRDALALLSPDEFPLTWGLVQHNLATALLQEGLESPGSEAGQQALSNAIEAFDLALRARQRPQMPLDWAITTVNLADALLARGTGLSVSTSESDREAGLLRIRGAIDHYKAALAELTTADRKKTLHNLEIAWRVLTSVAGADAAYPEIEAHRREVRAFAETPDAGSSRLPWPTEAYATAHRERKENIIQFLTRVWLPLIKAGGVDLRTLRLRDPSAAKAIDNFRRRTDPVTGQRRQLPAELDIPTKKQLNDRMAASLTDPGQRSARLDWALRSRARRQRKARV